MVLLSTAKAGRLIKKCKNQRVALSCGTFPSHANLSTGRKLIVKLGSNKSNICDLVWTCRLLVHLAMFLENSSSYRDDISARRHILYYSAFWKRSFTRQISGKCLSWRLLLLPWWSTGDFCPSRISVVHFGVYVACSRSDVFCLWPRFRLGVVLLLRRFWQTRVELHVLTFSRADTTVQAASWQLPTGRFVSAGVWTAQRWLVNVVICVYSSHLVLRRECCTVLLF